MMATGWRIKIASVDLNNNSLAYNDNNFLPIKNGMDYSHIAATKLSLTANDIYFNNDTVTAQITKGNFVEKNGFQLDQFTTSFRYTPNEISLNDLYLKTPGTELKEKIAIHYASPEALVNDMANMQLDIDLQNSKLLVKDLLTFVPALRNQPAFAYTNATWYINTRMTGRLADLDIDHLQLNGLQNTRIDIAGTIRGLPDMKNLTANLTIRNISSTKKDLNLFMPAGSLPSNITFPSRFNMNGKLNSSAGLMKGNLFINTDLGNARINGSVKEAGNANTALYNVTINTNNLDIGTLIQNKEIQGPVSATFTAVGKGYAARTANAKINGIIHSSIFHQYNYKNLKFNAAIADQHAAFDAAIVDPNIHFALNGAADLSMQYPAIRIEGMIDSIKLQPLHFTKEQTIFRGKIDGNFPITDPDNLQGELFITQSLLVRDKQRLKLDSIQLISGYTDSSQFLKINSNIMTARLEGKYQLMELGDIFQQAIQPYFAIVPGKSVITTTPYDFSLDAYILDNPAIKTFFPDLERLDSVSLKSHFSNAGWSALINAPAIDMGANHVRNLQLQAGTGNNAIAINGKFQQWKSGDLIQFENTTIRASLANNQIDFTLNSKDKSNKDKYNINGLLQQPQNGRYDFSFRPDSLLLNYDVWNVSPNNRLSITSGGDIRATDFILSKNGQELKINSTTAAINSPLEINFSNFQLGTLTSFIQSDSTLVKGTMNGKLLLTDIKKPLFTTDLTVNDLVFKNDTLGNLHALINTRTSDTYATDITLNGHGNDVTMKGTYFTQRTSDNFDFNLDVKSLPITTLQAFSNGKLNNASGGVFGKFAITGNSNRPIVKGDLNFDKAGFNFSLLNSSFTIDQEKIRVDEQGFRFDNFEIKDSAQNSLIVNGEAATSNFVNYRFDLDVRADNFMALNSTKKDNRLFYGRLFFNTNLNIKGTETSPMVDGNLVVNDKTRMTVVLPQREPGIVEREGIIEFVDMNAPLLDSLFLAAYDSLNMSGFTGMDIAVNLAVVPEAEFSLIIDEGNGDFLNVKGEAALTAGIDPSGKITLTGSYELVQGSYELTFNFLKRKFNIEKGSHIIWEGEPTDAIVDIKGIYIANAAPLDLVKNQLGELTAFERNTYLQKLPFDVHLDMQGQLMQPQIKFDIILPENKQYAVDGTIVSTVRTRLEQLRQEEGEMNKQVFSLLLLNRFIAENPFSSSTSSFNAGAFARQSVSKLLTEQLNNLAGDLVAGVDINFDVLASEDYTTGERKDRTDLNVGLSKKLLNDKLTVTVGSNFELEGPQNSGQQSNNIAGNIAIDYRISRDNRYLLRAYRKNEYQGVLDGYIIETGVGFIITVDYNRFREILMSRKDRGQRRLRRDEQRKINEQQKIQSTITDSIPPNL